MHVEQTSFFVDATVEVRSRPHQPKTAGLLDTFLQTDDGKSQRSESAAAAERHLREAVQAP
jgi:hypothetical protein